MHPRTADTILELPRFLRDITMLGLGHRWAANQHGGESHPVMVLPGFSAGNSSTMLLRRFIKRWGHDIVDWNLGSNMNLRELKSFDDFLRVRDNMVDKLVDDIQRASEDSDSTITLIGWSLGGVLARAVTSRIPEHVRQVVTLGTPHGDPRFVSIYALLNKLHDAEMSDAEVDQWMEMTTGPLHDTPLTVIYSHDDGLVHPVIASVEESERLQSIALPSSHIGMTVNPLVYHIIADRLAQCEHNWRHFKPRGLLQGLFDPGHYQHSE